jgi:hypothetical protein
MKVVRVAEFEPGQLTVGAVAPQDTLSPGDLPDRKTVHKKAVRKKAVRKKAVSKKAVRKKAGS